MGFNLKVGTGNYKVHKQFNGKFASWHCSIKICRKVEYFYDANPTELTEGNILQTTLVIVSTKTVKSQTNGRARDFQRQRLAKQQVPMIPQALAIPAP